MDNSKVHLRADLSVAFGSIVSELSALYLSKLHWIASCNIFYETVITIQKYFRWLDQYERINNEHKGHVSNCIANAVILIPSFPLDLSKYKWTVRCACVEQRTW